jgi:hypothetical protein
LLTPAGLGAQATHAALDQWLAGEAAVNFYILGDLDQMLESRGNRGYGRAQLEAGIHGGLMYLAATALGLRVTGLTFYDVAARLLGRNLSATAVLFLPRSGAEIASMFHVKSAACETRLRRLRVEAPNSSS